MAGMSEISNLELPGTTDLTEKIDGQSKAKKLEELMEMVETLQHAENLDPQIKDLVNRVTEFQKLKQKAKEEIIEAHALWKTTQKILDSLNVEQLHLEDVMRKRLEKLLQMKQEDLHSLLCQLFYGLPSKERFEEENRKVKKFLEAAAEQRQQLHHKRQRMVAEMEMLNIQFLSETYIISGEEADKEEVEHLSQAVQELCPGP